jgi:hypothetical protein
MAGSLYSVRSVYERHPGWWISDIVKTAISEARTHDFIVSNQLVGIIELVDMVLILRLLFGAVILKQALDSS